MKNILFSATALTALLASPLAAANGPIDGKLYGKINVSVVNSDDGTNDSWELKSNASRIGLKGSTEISEGLSVFYKTEFQVSADGDGDLFKKRNIYAGIKGKYGSLLAGNNDTLTKVAQKKIDLFNDLDGDIKYTFAGENREENTVSFQTKKFNNFSGSYAVMLKGGVADSKSYSVNYNSGNLYFAVAQDSNVNDYDILRIVSQYSTGPWQLGIMLQNEEHTDGTIDASGNLFSAAYKSGQITYKAQYGNNENDLNNEENTIVSFGADVKLAKNSKAFAFYTDRDSEFGDKTGVTESFGIGFEHKF